MEWETSEEEEQIRRIRIKKGMEEKNMVQKGTKDRSNTIIEAKDGWMGELLQKRERK
jgi:hypothetical protein